MLNQEKIDPTIFLIITVLTTVLFLVLWGSGPASAGLAYVTRCFAREEHSWILTDFIGKMKENFKQSMLIVFIDFFVLLFLPYAIMQYWTLYVAKNQFVWLILFCVCIHAFTIYTFMHYTIYQIMVTYDGKFRHLLKYSLLIAFGKAPMNLLLTIIPVAILFVLFNYLQPIPAMIIVLGLLFGFLRFPVEFYAVRTIPRILSTSTEDK